MSGIEQRYEDTEVYKIQGCLQGLPETEERKETMVRQGDETLIEISTGCCGMSRTGFSREVVSKLRLKE